MIKLNKWAGSFNEGEHRYFREDGKELQGVTGMLKRMLFKDEYKGISQAVLANAAERGHKIHSQIELYDNMGVGLETPEVAHYAALIADANLEVVASEYLVSDDENYASAIDKVFHIKGTPENEVVIGDIKTTSKFNREYVSWQLSVYAPWLERQNPHLKVVGLIGIWVREDNYRGSISKIIPVDRHPTEIVNELLRCSITGEEFNVEQLPTYISENLDRLIWLNETINAFTKEKEEIVKSILESMQKEDRDKIDTGIVLFSRKAASTTTRFDSKLFQEQHADLYKEYLKTSDVKASLTVKFRE